MTTRNVGFWVEHPLGAILHAEPKAIVAHQCPKCDKTFTGPVRQVLERYREHVLNSDHVFELEDCGSCGCSHFPEFDGDCREDWERF